VLRRKLGSERPVPEYGHVTPAKAVSLAISRAAQDLLRVPMSATEVSEARVSVAAMRELIPDGALCLVLRGPGTARGLVALDQVWMASVVEAQTRGRIEGGTVNPRAPTGTDAVLCTGFLAALLRGFSRHLAGHPAQERVDGFAPGERIGSLRLLPHALEDTAYRAFSVQGDIAGGTRKGRMVLILPWEAKPVLGAADLAEGEAAATDWTTLLGARVMDSPAVLEAVLCRLKLSLADVASLKPGARLALPMRCLGEVAMEGPEADQAGVWRLGQADGLRAVKLVSATATARGGQGAPDEDRDQPHEHTGTEPHHGQGPNRQDPKAASRSGSTEPQQRVENTAGGQKARRADAAVAPDPEEFDDLPELRSDAGWDAA
jgi:flagellar motor switch protein FliM